MKQTAKKLMLEFQADKNHSSFAKLHKKLLPGIKNYIRGIVKDRDVTEDLVSNTFLKIYTKIDQYDPHWQASTWAYTIAHRECLRWIKKERNPRVSISFLSDNGSEVIYDEDDLKVSNNSFKNEDFYEIKTHSDYIKQDTLISEQFEYAQLSIQNLKPMYRDILHDNLNLGLKYKEISEKYNLPLQTVKNRIRRAKQLVSESIADRFGNLVDLSY
jgi:RNA polymerase sigma factor (sigma-70 family)